MHSILLVTATRGLFHCLTSLSLPDLPVIQVRSVHYCLFNICDIVFIWVVYFFLQRIFPPIPLLIGKILFQEWSSLRFFRTLG